MAWTEKLPSGRYRGVYRDAAGSRRSAGTFAHKQAAMREASRREADSRELMWRDPAAYRRPWGDWAEEWWKSRGVDDTTRRTDAARRRLYLEPRWADVQLGSITKQDVKAWAADLGGQGISPNTVRRIVHLFSASLSAAVDHDVLPSNPAWRIKLAQGELEQQRYLTREEYALVREQMPTTDDQFIADLLVYTGMRWAEMAGLHRARVDLTRGFLRVAETYNEKAGKMKADPKGKRVRDVPLPQELGEAIAAREVAPTCGVDHVAGRCRSGLVITTPTGRPLRNSNWSVIWRDAVERSGVGHVRIHDLRHTYASWLIQDGIPLAEVGRLLGHVSPTTTQRYAHLADVPSDAVLAALAPRKSHGA